MPNDPFQLRRFGIYSDVDIALTENLYEHTEAYRRETHTVLRNPDLDAFLAYWTPERRARAVRGELTG